MLFKNFVCPLVWGQAFSIPFRSGGIWSCQPQSRLNLKNKSFFPLFMSHWDQKCSRKFFFFCQIKQKRIHAFWDDRKKIFCDASDVKKTFWWWWYLLCGKACVKRLLGSGCGSVGRAITSDTRGPRFESRHRQNLYWTLFTANCIEKTKIKKKTTGSAYLKTFLVAIVYACNIGRPGFDMDSRLTEHPKRFDYNFRSFCNTKWLQLVNL